MELRRFGKTNEMVSPLAFGCMRFKTLDGDNSKIDETEAIAQIRYAIDHSVNYIDTAYPYHGGNSEQLVAKALKDGYRERVFLATKLPSWLIKTSEDMDKYLDEQLNNLETDYIDFYLIHALNRKYWDNFMEVGLFDFIKRAKADGRIKHIGFSFHDELDLFKEIVDAYDWEFCMIQHNFMDEEYQAGTDGLKYAHSKGLGIAVMEPLRGGNLVKSVPDDVLEIWNNQDDARSPAQWAFSYIFNKEEVAVVLSGMNEFVQIDENIAEAKRTTPNSLSTAESATIEEVKNIYLSRIKVNCTGCNYCMPCPAGVAIPSCFEQYNIGSMYQNMDGAKWAYNAFIGNDNKASKCVECGQCEEACPQNLSIIEDLKAVASAFE